MRPSIEPYRRLLVRYLWPQWRKVLVLAVLLFSGVVLGLVNPLILRRFIDTAVSGAQASRWLPTAVLFFSIALMSQVLAVAETRVSEAVGWVATNGLRTDLTLHVLELDMPFHERHTPGELIERIDGDVTELARFFSSFVILVLGNSVLLGGILIVLFGVDWRLGAALTVYVAIVFMALSRIRNVAVPHWAAVRQASAELFGFVEERLAALDDIKANGAQEYTLRHLLSLMRQLFRQERRASVTNSLAISTPLILFTAGNAVGLALGAYLLSRGAISVGTVYMIFYYTELLRVPLREIGDELQGLQRAMASMTRVRELLGTQRSIPDIGTDLLPPRALSVEFQNVSFTYAAEDAILQDISFRLEAGKVLGLLGRTGSGKTTLARLNFRLYDPSQGVIRLADTDIRSVPLAVLRQRIGWVTQDVQLFHASARDNLAFFDATISDQRILQTIRDLGLWRWYESLPQALDTELGTGHHGLSAGQAQLFAFARVFLKEPGLVILDEATSRLDPASEQLLETAIDRLLHGRTGIIIAHRLLTLQRADEIMIFENGKICEVGNRELLAKTPASRFYGLLQTGLEEVLT